MLKSSINRVDNENRRIPLFFPLKKRNPLWMAGNGVRLCHGSHGPLPKTAAVAPFENGHRFADPLDAAVLLAKMRLPMATKPSDTVKRMVIQARNMWI